MNRKGQNNSLNSSIDLKNNGGRPVADKAYFDYQPKNLSNSYVHLNSQSQPQVSGFFMKGVQAKEGLLQHLRVEAQKQRLDNITKRLTLPYKNDTRMTKVNFFQNSQVGLRRLA
jgi:hypothetical protein